MLVKEIFQSIISWTSLVGVEPGDSDDVRLQKTLLVTGSVMVISATALWAAIYLIFDEPAAAAISLFYSVITLLSLVLFSITHRHRAVLFSQLLMGLALPNIQMFILGGFQNSSAVNLWSLISPLGALILYGSKRATRWWLTYLVIVILSGFAQPYVRASNNLPPAMISSFFVLNIAAVSSIAFITLNYFLRQREEAYRLLQIEEEKSERLLLNILPKEIAALLKNGERTIAEHFEEASILFADLVDFTPLTAKLSPVEMVELLNEVFSHFDMVVEKHGLEKIRTIGDNYMAVSGVPRPRSDHAQAIARAALEMKDYIQNRPSKNGERVQFRIGINSGPLVGGVIGRNKFVYDVWGDAVNVASRMESQGVAGKIQITPATYRLIQSDYVCERRGRIQVKGKGELETWFLQRPKTQSEGSKKQR